MAEKVTIEVVVDDTAARARVEALEARAFAVGRDGSGTDSGDGSSVSLENLGGRKLGRFSTATRSATVGALSASVVRPGIANIGASAISDKMQDAAFRAGAPRSIVEADDFIRSNPTIDVSSARGQQFMSDVHGIIDNSDMKAFKRRLPASSAEIVSLKGSIFAPGPPFDVNASRFAGFVRSPILDAPLESGSVTTGRATRPGLMSRAANNVRTVASDARAAGRAIKNTNFVSSRNFKTPFSTTSLGQLKEVGAMVGVIGGGIELLEVTNQIAEARSEYYKKLMLGEELPDGDYIAQGFGTMIDRVGVGLGSLSYKVMYALPATLLELGATTYEYLGGSVNTEAFGMALDMVSQSLRDELGLNADAYQQVRVNESAWQQSYTKLLGQIKTQTAKQADDVAARMQGLGLSGVSRADLKDSAYTHLIGPAIDKGVKEFEETNPYPTNRSVNPYGPDADTNLLAGALEVAGRVANPLSIIGG